MGFKKEFIIICSIILFLFFVGFINSTKDIITGGVAKTGILASPLKENEYLLYIKQPQWIERKLVELLEVTDDKEIIVSVNGNTRSISDKIIINSGLQIKKSVAVKEKDNKKSFAVLEIITVDQGRDFKCEEDDNGYNIYAKGTCYDYYYEMGLEDFCDGDYLKEYFCKYDEYVGEIHCMKETIKCEKTCIDGKCVDGIKAY